MAGWRCEFVVPGEEAVLALTLTIVVPVWNQKALLERLLSSIGQQTRPPDAVIVVDNGSTDGAPDVAKHWGARMIAMGQNRGFAAAVNRGISECSTEWVGLINSDVELRPDWIEKLLAALTETGSWFGCGKLLMSSDHSRVDGTWDLIATSGFPLRAGNSQPDAPTFAVRRSIALASATATIYRRELFQLVGAFDESYESYLEDVDLSLRCAARNLKGIYEPAAVGYHVGGASRGRMVHLYARNQILLVRKLFPAELQRKFRSRIFIGRLLWGALALRHGQLSAWVSGNAAARRTAIQSAPLDLEKLKKLLLESEREIRATQRSDTYWRLYFLLTQGESQ